MGCELSSAELSTTLLARLEPAELRKSTWVVDLLHLRWAQVFTLPMKSVNKGTSLGPAPLLLNFCSAPA